MFSSTYVKRFVKRFFWFFLVSLFVTTGAIAQEDMPGSFDHPDFPRLPEAVIATYVYNQEGHASHIEGTDFLDIDKYILEGEVTKLLYLLPATKSSTHAAADYLKLFQSLGTFEAYYSCSGGICGREVTSFLHWPSPNNRSPQPVITPNSPVVSIPDFILRYPQRHKNMTYISGEIQTATGTYTVSLYTAENTRATGVFDDNQAFVDLQIVKNGKRIKNYIIK